MSAAGSSAGQILLKTLNQARDLGLHAIRPRSSAATAATAHTHPATPIRRVCRSEAVMAATMLSAMSSTAFAGKALSVRPTTGRVQVRGGRSPAVATRQRKWLAVAKLSSSESRGAGEYSREVVRSGADQARHRRDNCLSIPCRSAQSPARQLAAGCRAPSRRRIWRRPSESQPSLNTG